MIEAQIYVFFKSLNKIKKTEKTGVLSPNWGVFSPPRGGGKNITACRSMYIHNLKEYTIFENHKKSVNQFLL